MYSYAGMYLNLTLGTTLNVFSFVGQVNQLFGWAYKKQCM